MVVRLLMTGAGLVLIELSLSEFGTAIGMGLALAAASSVLWAPAPSASLSAPKPEPYSEAVPAPPDLLAGLTAALTYLYEQHASDKMPTEVFTSAMDSLPAVADALLRPPDRYGYATRFRLDPCEKPCASCYWVTDGIEHYPITTESCRHQAAQPLTTPEP
jgi:hypothetical protein